MIESIKIQGDNYLVNGNKSVPKDENNRHYKEVLEAIAGGTEKYPAAIPVLPEDEVSVGFPTVVSMAQARAALIQSGMLDSVNNFIANSGDAMLINDWEYRTEVRKDWAGLDSIANSLGMTEADVDGLFILASTL